MHAGLGIVEAITTTLNPRLEQDKGVQLGVRIGLHTGSVVGGEMGGGGRHEHLATGDTVNIAARLEGLAAPNTLVISRVTARLVRQACVLEDLARHTLKGVAEPMPVFLVLRPLEVQADQPLELFDTRQDFPAEQRDFFHHFPVVGARLLEAQVHHAHAALVMERLQLLHDGVGAPHQGQQPPPGLDRLPGSLGAAGSTVAVARVERLSVARREHRPGH